MAGAFVPAEFEPPTELRTSSYRMEPLGEQHNERDHMAWMSSIGHIHATPGFENQDWPLPMTLEANRSDLVSHAVDFEARTGFTYSILDGDEVIGCLYIYPHEEEAFDAHVRSWVTEARAELDVDVWRTVTDWLATTWPFTSIDYAARNRESR